MPARFPSAPSRFASRAVPLSALVLSLGIVAAFAWLTWRSERATAIAQFEAVARETAHTIDERLETYVDVLVGGAALFNASEHVSLQEFRSYIGSLALQERYPGVLGVGFSARVLQARADSVVAAQRAAGLTEFTLRPAPASDSVFRHVIIYIEPLGVRNRAALGFDMYSHPVRRAAMARARDTGRPAASGLVTLVQEIDENVQPGFVIYVPVYAGTGTPATVEERRARLAGFVHAAFRAHDLIRGAVGEQSHIELDIYDGPVTDTAAMLFASDPAQAGEATDAAFSSRIPIDVDGRTWTVVVRGDRAFHDGVGTLLGRTALILGVLLSIVLYLLTRSQVAARQRAQEALGALARSEEQYRLLFEGNPHPMWVYDIDTLAFVAVNSAAVERYGYSREEFRAMRLPDIRPEADRPLLESVLRGAVPDPGIWRHVQKDGSIILAEVTGSMVEFQGRPARLVHAHDVTERIRSETELQQAQQRLTQILNLSNAIIYTMDVSGENLVPTWLTENLERVTGYSMEEGRAPGWWYDNLHPDDRDMVMGTTERLFEQGRRSIEYRFRCKDGNYIWFRDDAVVHRDADGAPRELIGAWLDVSDRRRLEGQFQQAQKMEAVGRLAGGIAHDFNNILTIIRSQADLLLADLAGDAIAADLAVIQAAADRGAKLTSQLLAFGREQLLRPTVISVNDVVRGLEAMLSRIVGERMRLEHDLAVDLPPIEADQGQLEQVIMNLVVNARDAMPEGGAIRFRTRVEGQSAARTAVDGGILGRFVVLSVADSGTGIDESVRERIFDPFFTTKPRGKGTGLGLAMVYGFVTQSGGDIRVQSEPGQGTTFDLLFPASTKAVEEVARPAASPVRPLRLRGRVLLVEDEPSVALVARRILERAGLDVREATDAESALALLENREADYDLLLTDFGLPGLSGGELIRRVRRLRPAFPTIVMSGYAEDRGDGGGELPHDVEFVQKPFAADSLRDAVRRALSRA